MTYLPLRSVAKVLGDLSLKKALVFLHNLIQISEAVLSLRTDTSTETNHWIPAVNFKAQSKIVLICMFLASLAVLIACFTWFCQRAKTAI